MPAPGQAGERWVRYARWLSGVGLDYILVCPACLAELEKGQEIKTATICVDCRDWLEEEVGDLRAVRGRPEVRERLRPIGSSISQTPIPATIGRVLDIAPIDNEPSHSLVLDAEGRVARVDLEKESWTGIATVGLIAEAGHEPWMNHHLSPRLHASPAGDFFAVVNDYGRKGAIYRAGQNEPVLRLDSGGGHAETVPFSFAFIEHRGRCVAIHRTAWNRLDATDPDTGDCLTDRGPTSYLKGEPIPEHYLDYFHGRLTVSPDGRLIVDDGWVWHPVGVVTTWDIDTWLSQNVWESDDGPTKTTLAARDYYWDCAISWVGLDRIAVGGIGDDDELMIDGARIFSAAAAGLRYGHRHAQELATFAGPSGRFFSDGQALFSVNGTGLSVWDGADGVRMGRLEGFRPTHQHRDGELVGLQETGLLRWRYRS